MKAFPDSGIEVVVIDEKALQRIADGANLIACFAMGTKKLVTIYEVGRGRCENRARRGDAGADRVPPKSDQPITG